MRPRRCAVLVTAIALVLGGCAPFGDGDAPTSPSSTGAGRQLTDAEAEAALPTRPEGAQVSPKQSQSKDQATDPKECIDVLRAGEVGTALSKDEVAEASRSWTTSSPHTRHSFRVESYSHPVGPELFDRAGSAIGGCDAFALTGHDDDGFFDLRVLAEPLFAASLGEQTFAVRLTSFEQVDGRTEPYYIDFVVVRVGHNLVEVSTTHRDEDAGIEDLEDAARGILDALDDSP